MGVVYHAQPIAQFEAEKVIDEVQFTDVTSSAELLKSEG